MIDARGAYKVFVTDINLAPGEQTGWDPRNNLTLPMPAEGKMS
jgi:hypothetical protein